ncbi:membrane protein insertase YidC [Oxobacter pfennigii]|uniref:Membrane protein insertase YidC n=1 Tax=Oxobacter pfennigii TaxID=36849 RepID=A0A0P8W5L9_9CLOT|nr:YidC/Oxa1 family membrane protein insertase [Oxobacter pfennigii]KPU42953.1 membrane protein insertase YidC [Oxobacter pfennigii]
MDAIKNILIDIFNWIHTIVPDYGLDIILFTLLLKVVLLPFNILQTNSTVKTQMIQPKIKELQVKYKNDPQKLQQAQMDLYKSEGVNPFAGCLPLLIQMPVLFAVFYVFREFNFGDATFLGVALQKPLKEAGNIVLVLFYTLLSGASTFLSTWLLTPKNQEPNAMTNNRTNVIMSVFFAYISYTMTTGLVVYWVINNLLQMGIQYSLNKFIRKRAEVAAQK